MNIIMLIFAVLGFWGILNKWSRGFIGRRKKYIHAANVGEGCHNKGKLTKKADAAIATKYLLVKVGTDADHVAACGATDRPLGVCYDEADAAEDYVAVFTFGAAGETLLMIANGAVTMGDLLYTAASGKVSSYAAAGSFCVGRALTTATADGDQVEVDPRGPALAGHVNRLCDAALTLDFTVVKAGSTPATGCDVCTAAYKPIGIAQGTAVITTGVAKIALLNGDVLPAIASEAIAVGDDVYVTALGKVAKAATILASAGTYYRIGRAVTATTATGQTIQIKTCSPIKVVVSAKMTNVNSAIGNLTFSSTPTQAEANALRDACETLADDVRAIQAAVTSDPAELVFLAA